MYISHRIRRFTTFVEIATTSLRSRYISSLKRYDLCLFCFFFFCHNRKTKFLCFLRIFSERCKYVMLYALVSTRSPTYKIFYSCSATTGSCSRYSAAIWKIIFLSYFTGRRKNKPLSLPLILNSFSLPSECVQIMIL